MPTFDGPLRRETVRLRGLDYGAGSSYFVTICTAGRTPILASIASNGTVLECDAGRFVRAAWDALPDRFPAVHPDAFVVMPDHIHAVLTITEGPNQPEVAAPTLSRVIGVLKSMSTVTINRHRGRSGESIWQRSYHDRVIRNEVEYLHVCEYVAENPIRWASARNIEGGGAGELP